MGAAGADQGSASQVWLQPLEKRTGPTSLWTRC